MGSVHCPTRVGRVDGGGITVSQEYWILGEELGRELIRARHEEAERDRLARLASKPGRSARAALAVALRAIAYRLDGGARPAAERRPAAAR
jgi:hypothetical protein